LGDQRRTRPVSSEYRVLQRKHSGAAGGFHWACPDCRGPVSGVGIGDPSIFNLTSGSMKLHSTIMGEGIPFLILHGFLGMGDNWKTLGRKFSEAGFQVHLLDQRNHGRSPHSDEMSYLEMAKDLKEYCDSHNISDCILMGHSMGGKTAMWTAALFSQLVQKLIVVDIAPKYYAPHHQDILEGLKALDAAALNSRGDAEDLLEKHIPDNGTRL